MTSGVIMNGNNYTYLTKKEVEILDLLLLGKTNDEIAQSLGIRINTLKRHMTNIYNKTIGPGLRSHASRVKLALWYQETKNKL